jgi:membrane-bound lytic murein transglycosylase D
MSLPLRRLVVACAAFAIIGCGGRSATVAQPTPPPTPSLNPETFQGRVGPEIPVLPDPIGNLIAESEREFEAGKDAIERNLLVAAREHFDRSIEMLLAQPDGARTDPRLRKHFDQLLDRISALELLALREADGLTEARTEPAALDELLTEAMFERPQPLHTTSETVAADLDRNPTELSITVNTKVLSYVELFQGNLRDFMQGGLDRGMRYLPMIQRVFKEEGLPLELAYVPLIESAFKTNALSRASAKGMWQFMLGTAHEHGLKYTWFIDERSDPEKATRAAAQYLKSLGRMWDGDWELALASYNGGPGRVQRALSRSRKTTFWDVSASTRYLPRETREYVPMILAAAIIGRNPTLYGFDSLGSTPLMFEQVRVPDALDLRIIAEWAGVDVESLQELNPELRRTTTPAGGHDLKVPIGTATTIQSRLASAEPSLFVKFEFHTVRRGETLASIARRYKVNQADLRAANELPSNRVSANQQLRIPARSTSGLPAAGRPSASASTMAARTGSSGPLTYQVRRGDTLVSIARRFDTTVESLKRINQLSSDRIGIGQRLTVRR